MEPAKLSDDLVRCWCQPCSGDFDPPRCERDHRQWPRDTEAITQYHQSKTAKQQQLDPAALVAVDRPGQHAAAPVLSSLFPKQATRILDGRLQLTLEEASLGRPGSIIRPA